MPNPDEKKAAYTSPQVQTLAVRELLESVGPAQALSSGTQASELPHCGGSPHR